MNNSAEYGGGIYCESSSLTFVHDRSCYLSNIALRGGAQYFDLYSNFSLYQTARLHFQDNNATELGGAIYAVDASGPGQFLSQQHVAFRRECFFHIRGNKQPLQVETTPLIFVNNSAGEVSSMVVCWRSATSHQTDTQAHWNYSTCQLYIVRTTGVTLFHLNLRNFAFVMRVN